ncbi:MAG: zinc-ribbon domain-containing protein [Pseudomonadota bacterium]
MRIICPNCGSQYEVDQRLFGPEGRDVQCAQCDTQWTQYPVDEAPTPLRTASTPVADPPSSRLPAEERDEIREAVAHEIAVRDVPPPPADDPAANGEDDLIRSLREQLKQVPEEPDDEVPDIRRPTGRRNIAKAADIAGVTVVDDETAPDERTSRPARPRAAARPTTSVGSRDLAQALEEYERERRPRSGGRVGFVLALIVGLLAAGGYLGRTEIARQLPEAAPALEAYASGVDSARRMTEWLYGEARVLVTSAVSELQSGSEADQTPE